MNCARILVFIPAYGKGRMLSGRIVGKRADILLAKFGMKQLLDGPFGLVDRVEHSRDNRRHGF